MRREYRIQFRATLLDDGIFWHIARWSLLTIVTSGLALLFYPFYFIRFLADRITIVEITEEDRATTAATLHSRAESMALGESAKGEECQYDAAAGTTPS